MRELSKKDIKELVDRGIVIPIHKVRDKEIIDIIKKISEDICNKKPKTINKNSDDKKNNTL